MLMPPGALPDSEDVTLAQAGEASLFRTLFDLSPDPVVVHDGRRILEINDAAARVLGFDSACDAVGARVSAFVHPDDRPAMARKVAAMLGDLEFEPITSQRFVTRAGDEIHGDVAARPIMYLGRPAIMLMVRDVTDRVRAEEAARTSEENHNILFELSPDPTVVHDGETILKANEAMGAFMGVDPRRAEGMPLWPLVDDHDRAAIGRSLSRLAATGVSPDPFEVSLRRADGAQLMVETASSQITLLGRPFFITVFRDLTPRRLAEQEAEGYRLKLEALVHERTAELAEMRTELEAIVAVVMRTVELRDPYTAGHQERVALLAEAIAGELGFDDDDRDHLAVAARLHDIGKVPVPAEILSTPGRLGDVEYALMQGHAQATADILLSVKLDWPLASIARQHHERLDGSGYPDGLVGDEILPMARVLAVADVVEAMISHRPYRPAVGVDAALSEIRTGRGVLYDAAAVDACLRTFQAGFAFED